MNHHRPNGWPQGLIDGMRKKYFEKELAKKVDLMNLEEERKAFLEALSLKLIDRFGCGSLVEGFNKDTFDHESVQEYFEIWLAAKRHAEEMAKPTGRVKQGASGDWWVLYDVYQYEGIESREAAEKWLTDRGYRVIEE